MKRGLSVLSFNRKLNWQFVYVRKNHKLSRQIKKKGRKCESEK